MAITKGTPPGREPKRPGRGASKAEMKKYETDLAQYNQSVEDYEDAQRGSVRAHTKGKKGGGKGMHGEEGEKMGRQPGHIGKLHAETGATPVKSLHTASIRDLFPNV